MKGGEVKRGKRKGKRKEERRREKRKTISVPVDVFSEEEAE